MAPFMHTAVPANPASMTGPSQTTGRPVAMTTFAPARAARRSASALRVLTRRPSRSSRVPSMSVTTRRGVEVIREGADTTPFSPTGTAALPRSPRGSPSRNAQHPVEVAVAEPATRIDGVADGAGIVEPWVALTELFGVERVQL